MPLLCYLHQLQQHGLDLNGVLSVAELELDSLDELIHFRYPLEYDLHVELVGRSILVKGNLKVLLDCECARCLSPFQKELHLPDWSVLLPLEGQDRVPVRHDSVDLAPFIREDTLLALPQHPLCKPDCLGLTYEPGGGGQEVLGDNSCEGLPSTWVKLSRLRL
jgi:uncharacterized protein